MQPKAAGSSVLMKLANSLALDVIKLSGKLMDLLLLTRIQFADELANTGT